MLRTIFTDIVIVYSGGDTEQTIKKSATYVDKNSYLTIYIASFIDYLANGSSKFADFLGSDFTASKKAEIKFYLDKIIKDKNGSPSQRFAKHLEESKLFDFDFKSYFDADENVVIYLLETIDNVIRFDIMLMLVNKIKFKPCKCCGEYFIPRGRINNEYCKRIMPWETKPCSKIDAPKTFDIVHKDDVSIKNISQPIAVWIPVKEQSSSQRKNSKSSVKLPVQNERNAITAKLPSNSSKPGSIILDN